MAALPLRIAPSLLSCDFARIGEEVARCEEAGADWLHVDVMDGHFVPNLTIGPAVVKAIASNAALPLDVHLMIEEPGRWAQDYADAGADVLTFHYETVGDDADAVVEAFRATGCKVGVAVNPDCPVDGLRTLLDRVDMVLVMSVFAGFGGQRFLRDVLEKVRAIRSWGWQGDIEMDGGINGETVAECAEAGANVFVAGSYLFSHSDMKDAITQMRETAARATAATS